MDMHCWLFHQWGKWELIKVGFVWEPPSGGPPLSGTKSAQERVCTQCGKRQREMLDD